MGLLWSRWRKKTSTEEVLEGIHKEILAIETFKRDTISWQKKLIGYLLAYFSVLYLAAAAIAYFRFFYHPEWQTWSSQLVLWVPFLIAPVLLWVVRKILTWWYHRKIRRNEHQLSTLIKKKTDILNEVMDKETYKVAKEILEKYAPEKLVSKSSTALSKSQFSTGDKKLERPSDSKSLAARRNEEASLELRKRPISSLKPTTGNLNATQPVGYKRESLVDGKKSSAPMESKSFSIPNRTSSSTITAPNMGARNMNPNFANSPSMNQSMMSPGPGIRPPGPPLPRPVLQRERGYMDKMVEYLVGDGPSNRYALICKQCQSHNGMALKEEFEYISYRCCYCFYWNPARKQRPRAPKLTATLTKQSSTETSEDEKEGQPSITTKQPITNEAIVRGPTDNANDQVEIEKKSSDETKKGGQEPSHLDDAIEQDEENKKDEKKSSDNETNGVKESAADNVEEEQGESKND